MPAKIVTKNSWNSVMARKSIINAIESLEEENPNKKDRYFSQIEIKEKVLETARDLDGNNVKWWVIKPTFYRILKDLVDRGILTNKKEKRKDKYSPYSFYKLKRSRDDKFELKGILKESEIESIKMSLTNASLYKYRTRTVTNISLSPRNRDEIINDVKKLRRKVIKRWLEDEIEVYIKSLLEVVKTLEPQGDITKKHLISYSLQHLDWWIQFNGEKPTRYRKYINEILEINKFDRKMTSQYETDLRKLYEKKRKWINEIAVRMWKEQPYTENKLKEIQPEDYHKKFLTVIKEIANEGNLTEEEVKLLSIQNEMSIIFSMSDIYLLPKVEPMLVVKI